MQQHQQIADHQAESAQRSREKHQREFDDPQRNRNRVLRYGKGSDPRQSDDHDHDRRGEPGVDCRLADDQSPDDTDGGADGAWKADSGFAKQFKKEFHDQRFHESGKRNPFARVCDRK